MFARYVRAYFLDTKDDYEKNSKYKYGFIYPTAKSIITLLRLLNLIEWLKVFSGYFYLFCNGEDASKDGDRKAKSIAIDVYMILKWGLVLFAIYYQVSSTIMGYVIWYLIASNLFSYFYYHAWSGILPVKKDLPHQQRRFLAFMLSLAFYLVCYAYLYEYQYSDLIAWPDGCVNTTNALYLSVATAFTLTYGGFQPLVQEARVLFASELINTFFFFVIILSKSIPDSE
ncbi:hypothetical protein V5T82_16940 [Magnetovibrio sp. PR-2]|uniref:hypothetical protein n=1 Tax=Magnetovibrio sp. PR-2 TaxID=3120356 RepID=UPI002FCE23D5